MSESGRLAHPESMDDLLLYRINRLLGVAGSMVIRLCEGRFGITRREWRVLALMAHDEGLRSSQLAERAQLDRARTSKAITSLVAKGLVQRDRSPGDRRQATLMLTAQGRALHDALFPLVAQINQALLAQVPAQEVAGLDRLLDHLQQRADALVLQSDLPKADRRRGGRFPRSIG